jgi:hypothetical protein
MKFIFLLLFFLGACADPNYVTVEKMRDLEWEVYPTETTEGSFHVRTSFPTDLNVEVELWMPSMGHGSSPVTVTKISDTHFLATEVFFIMPGPWEIRINWKDGTNVVDQTVFDITI